MHDKCVRENFVIFWLWSYKMLIVFFNLFILNSSLQQFRLWTPQSVAWPAGWRVFINWRVESQVRPLWPSRWCRQPASRLHWTAEFITQPCWNSIENRRSEFGHQCEIWLDRAAKLASCWWHDNQPVRWRSEEAQVETVSGKIIRDEQPLTNSLSESKKNRNITGSGLIVSNDLINQGSGECWVQSFGICETIYSNCVKPRTRWTSSLHFDKTNRWAHARYSCLNSCRHDSFFFPQLVIRSRKHANKRGKQKTKDVSGDKSV